MNAPRIQLALDVRTIDDAVRIASQAAPSVDIIEAGTVLVLSEGLRAVQALKRAVPGMPVCADIRIGRAGAKFADLAFGAGADTVTVLGESPDDVIAGAVSSARRHGGRVELELPPHWTIADLERWLGMGIDGIIAHRSGADDPEHDDSIRSVLAELSTVDLHGIPVTLAGGLSQGDFQFFEDSDYDVVAIGSAISGHPDPSAAARSIRDELAGVQHAQV